MLEFALGFAATLAALVFFNALRRRRWRRSAWGHRRSGSRSRSRRRHAWWLRRLSWHLDTSPQQDQVLREVAQGLRDDVFAELGDLREARREMADALRDDELDGARLDALFGRYEAALATLRTTGTDALRTVHDSLDAEQRARLADLIAGASRRRACA